MIHAWSADTVGAATTSDRTLHWETGLGVIRVREEVRKLAGKKSSGGGKARSAISGRYVRKSTAKKNPRTTVVEHDKKRK